MFRTICVIKDSVIQHNFSETLSNTLEYFIRTLIKSDANYGNGCIKFTDFNRGLICNEKLTLFFPSILLIFY